MRKLTMATLALAALSTAACAGTISKMKSESGKLDYREYAGEPVDQFTAFDIDSWSPVSRNQLVVWTGINDAYLLTVWDSCDNLQFAERIAVNRTSSSVSKLDSVTVRGQRCPITDIRPVDIKRMKTDRAAMRAQSG